MPYIFRRLGFGISPGWSVMILLVGLIVAAAFWVGPLRPLPPELRLVALQPDGTFTDSIAAPAHSIAGQTRFPLALAAHNAGYSPARPTVLELSVPLGFHLVDRDGRAYPRATSPGTPLGRYALGITAATMLPGSVPELLLDTIWLEPDVDSYTCTVLSDGVPEFAPRPPIVPGLLRRVDIFYSFRTPDTDARQAGLLQVRVDSSALRQPPALMGEPGVPTITEPEAPLPAMGGLYQVSTTVASCGDPQQPVELQSVVYANEAGGRFIVVYNDGQPRKYLIDVNGDSIVEQELWDPDADGAFEGARTTRYSIPAFLFPRATEQALLAADTVPPDSAFLALYRDTARGPFRFAAALRPQPADSGAPPAVAASPPGSPPPALPTGAAIPADTTPVDSAWLALYRDTAAGPFRFARGRPPPPAAADSGTATSIAAGVISGTTTTAATPAGVAAGDTTGAGVEDTAAAAPPPPRRTGPRILGTPVEYPPGTRPPPD